MGNAWRRERIEKNQRKNLLKTITNSIWVFSCVRGDDTTTSEKIYILPTWKSLRSHRHTHTRGSGARQKSMNGRHVVFCYFFLFCIRFLSVFWIPSSSCVCMGAICEPDTMPICCTAKHYQLRPAENVIDAVSLHRRIHQHHPFNPCMGIQLWKIHNIFSTTNSSEKSLEMKWSDFSESFTDHLSRVTHPAVSNSKLVAMQSVWQMEFACMLR